MKRLHQFVPTLDPGAVGTHLLNVQRALRADGWESLVFSEHTRAPYEDAALPFTEYGRSVPAHDEDVLVYHAAIGSSVADFLLSRRPRRLVVDYHNITPPSWYEGWDANLVNGLAWGRAQLSTLARRSRIGWADSGFNAGELATYGFRETAILPILIDTATLHPPGRERAAAPEGAQWLFVGRVAPNKCQQDLVKAFAVYRRTYDAGAHLWLVGGGDRDPFGLAVGAFIDAAGLAGSVTLTGLLDDASLGALWAKADVFVVVSEHEGFLVPLLESWRARVPVVAYGAAAVPETLGQGGLRLDDKSPFTVAAAVHRVVTDDRVRRALIDAGTRRLADFALARTTERLLELAREAAA